VRLKNLPSILIWRPGPGHLSNLGDGMSRIIVLCTVLFIAGCDEVTDRLTQAINKGTLKGVEARLNSNRSTLVSEEDIRNRCVEHHKVSGSIDATAWKANISIQDDRLRIRSLGMEGGWKNTSDNFIVTEVEITGVAYDDSGKRFSGSSTEKGLWVLPGEPFSVASDVIIKGLPKGMSGYCKNDLFKNCVTWMVPSFKGIKFKVN